MNYYKNYERIRKDRGWTDAEVSRRSGAGADAAQDTLMPAC